MPATAEDISPEPLINATTAGLRELNERIVAEAKKAGNVTVDLYESTFRTFADYTEKVGAASPIDLVSTITSAQANLTRELSGGYAKAARTLLK